MVVHKCHLPCFFPLGLFLVLFRSSRSYDTYFHKTPPQVSLTSTATFSFTLLYCILASLMPLASPHSFGETTKHRPVSPRGGGRRRIPPDGKPLGQAKQHRQEEDRMSCDSAGFTSPDSKEPEGKSKPRKERSWVLSKESGYWHNKKGQTVQKGAQQHCFILRFESQE